jgi:hypothetical protein
MDQHPPPVLGNSTSNGVASAVATLFLLAR